MTEDWMLIKEDLDDWIDYDDFLVTDEDEQIAREEDWTWSVEGSAGYEMTNYRSDKDDYNSPVLLGRTYLKKKILDNAFISEDFTVIPTLDNTGTRIKSETEFTNPLSEGLDLSVKYIVEHDTEPSPDKKKTDTRLITSIKYSF